MIRFQALDRTLKVIRSLRGPEAEVRRRDRRLADQLRSAASSVALNLAEGNRRSGKDRRYHFLVAAGSAEETRAALLVAEAWGDVDPSSIQEALRALDEVLAITWRLTR